MTPEQAAALREPFPKEQIGHLPKAGVQLDYVGHAAVTSRLLAVDPTWSWEPVSFAEAGEPRIVVRDKDAWLWIRLTVCGVTRLGVGTARVDAFELPKQLISDAIRNAAMRFGVALDLWSKEEIGEAPAGLVGENPSEATQSRQRPNDRTQGVVATPGSAGPGDIEARASLGARARMLAARSVAEARRVAGLPTIAKSDPAQLLAWDRLLTELETA